MNESQIKSLFWKVTSIWNKYHFVLMLFSDNNFLKNWFHSSKEILEADIDTNGVNERQHN